MFSIHQYMTYIHGPTCWCLLNEQKIRRSSFQGKIEQYTLFFIYSYFILRKIFFHILNRPEGCVTFLPSCWSCNKGLVFLLGNKSSTCSKFYILHIVGQIVDIYTSEISRKIKSSLAIGTGNVK